MTKVRIVDSSYDRNSVRNNTTNTNDNFDLNINIFDDGLGLSWNEFKDSVSQIPQDIKDEIDRILSSDEYEINDVVFEDIEDSNKLIIDGKETIILPINRVLEDTTIIDDFLNNDILNTELLFKDNSNDVVLHYITKKDPAKPAYCVYVVQTLEKGDILVIIEF